MKATASLTGSLLARKGAAYPAAYSAPTPSSDDSTDGADSSPARAYNDPRVIASAPPAAVAPAAFSNPAPQQVETPPDAGYAPRSPSGKIPAIDRVSMAQPMPATQPAPSADPDAQDGGGLPQVMDKMGRVRLSVRLDPDRYLRVKMASARTRWSAQDIVIAALDRYLGGKAGSDASNDDGDDGDSQGNLN